LVINLFDTKRLGGGNFDSIVIQRKHDMLVRRFFLGDAVLEGLKREE